MTPDAIRPTRTTAVDPHVQLRKMAKDMEALFTNQMFQAMRATVSSSEGSDDPARAMFTGLLDQQIAGLAAQQQTRGLGEALYHQLARRLDAAGVPPTEKGN